MGSDLCGSLGPRFRATLALVPLIAAPGARPPPTPPILSPRPAHAVGSPAPAADAVSREGFAIIRVRSTSGFSCRHDDRLTSDPCSSPGGRWRCVGSDLLCRRYGHMCRAYAYITSQCLSPSCRRSWLKVGRGMESRICLALGKQASPNSTSQLKGSSRPDRYILW